MVFLHIFAAVIQTINAFMKKVLLLFGSASGSYSHTGDAIIYRSRLVGNVYTREATDYRRHYTTSYTDVIVLNQLRPREFLFKVFFNI